VRREDYLLTPSTSCTESKIPASTTSRHSHSTKVRVYSLQSTVLVLLGPRLKQSHTPTPTTHINHLRNHHTFSLFIGILEQRVESSSSREIRLFADSANLLVLLFISSESLRSRCKEEALLHPIRSNVSKRLDASDLCNPAESAPTCHGQHSQDITNEYTVINV